MRLEEMVDLLQTNKDELYRQYISENRPFRRKALSVMTTNDKVNLVRYAWKNVFKPKTPIPELVQGIDINRVLGRGIFAQLGVSNEQDAPSLLSKAIDEYGTFDDEKLSIFVTHHDGISRSILYPAFFLKRKK